MIVLRWLLLPFALLYGALSALRRFLYEKDVLSAWSCPVPVVSVGNLAVGGSGKTPVVMWLARALTDRGWRVAIVSRGYKRHSRGPVWVSDGENILADVHEAGDEPLLLARRLPGVLVGVGEKRREIMQRILDQAGVDIFLMDDGFQHLQVRRDRDWVLHDCAAAFSDQWPMPTGRMRGFRSELKRADRLLDTSGHGACGAIPLRFEIDAFYLGIDNTPVSLQTGAIVCLFTTIARPERFKKSMEQCGLRVSAHIAFPDHHDLTAADIRRVADAFGASKARWLVCTGKDWIKIYGNPELEKAFGAAVTRWLVTTQKVIIEQEKVLLDDVESLMKR